MTHPAIALQTELFEKLENHAALQSMLGGSFIYDDVPRKKKPPYITFAESVHNDWSTGSEEGMEHFVTLNIWSPQNGRKQALEVSELIMQALDEEQLASEIDEHFLVNFTYEEMRIARDEKSENFKASMTFRAVTERQSNQ